MVDGIICTEILLLKDQFGQKEHFSQIFSISVNELCQVLIIKAGNILLCIKDETAAIFFKNKAQLANSG